MERIQVLNGHFAGQEAAARQPTTNVWESLNMDRYLRPEVVAKRKATGVVMEEIYKDLIPHINDCSFPFWVVPKFQKLGISGLEIKDFGGPGFTIQESGAIAHEISKRDGSIATFFMVHCGLGMSPIDQCGSQEQRERILPDCLKLNKIVCFGLTEPDYGSDATSLKTTATKVEGGYRLNGSKRWIGNATFADYIIIWARNPAEKNNIQGFLVTKGSPGLKTSAIQNKYALRMVQNADIELNDVFVPDNMRLEKATNFQKSTNAVLEQSRLMVAYMTAGMATGAYEAALKYCLNRQQFGRPIAKFQLIQEKLSRMLSNCEMMLSYLNEVAQIAQEKKSTPGLSSRAKSFCTLKAREVVKLAREVCGGNGIILDNHVIKSLCDLEAYYTYEGTYETNMLVSGRELTGGLAAFK